MTTADKIRKLRDMFREGSAPYTLADDLLLELNSHNGRYWEDPNVNPTFLRARADELDKERAPAAQPKRKR